jgi:hypothetical protein
MAAVDSELPFTQVDVFAPGPKPGNPVAVDAGTFPANLAGRPVFVCVQAGESPVSTRRPGL